MENAEKVLRVLLLGQLIYADNDTIKEIKGRVNDSKKEIREIMEKDLDLKKVNDDKIQVEIRPKNPFDIDIFEDKNPELYKKYVKIESRIVTITEKDTIFDKKKLMKFNREEYDNCRKKGTTGVHITRLNT